MLDRGRPCRACLIAGPFGFEAQGGGSRAGGESPARLRRRHVARAHGMLPPPHGPRCLKRQQDRRTRECGIRTEIREIRQGRDQKKTACFRPYSTPEKYAKNVFNSFPAPRWRATWTKTRAWFRLADLSRTQSGFFFGVSTVARNCHAKIDYFRFRLRLITLDCVFRKGTQRLMGQKAGQDLRVV